jgi:hypothetical protein
LKKLGESSKDQEISTFSVFDFAKEIQKIEETFKKKKGKNKKYSIIKELVKYVTK